MNIGQAIVAEWQSLELLYILYRMQPCLQQSTLGLWMLAHAFKQRGMAYDTHP